MLRVCISQTETKLSISQGDAFFIMCEEAVYESDHKTKSDCELAMHKMNRKSTVSTGDLQVALSLLLNWTNVRSHAQSKAANSVAIAGQLLRVYARSSEPHMKQEAAAAALREKILT